MINEKYQWTQYFPKFFDKIYNKTSETLYKEYNEKILGPLKNAKYSEYKYDFSKIDPLSFFTRIINLKKIWSVIKLYDNTIEFQNPQQCGIPFIDNNKLEWWKEAYKTEENSEIFNTLEKFAQQIHEDKIDKNLFNKICRYNDNGLIKTSVFLFYIRPEKYYPLDKKMQNYAKFSIGNNIDDYYEEFCKLQKLLQEKFKNDNRKIYEISDSAHQYYLSEKNECPEKYLKPEKIIAIAMYKDNAESYNRDEIKNLEFCKLYLKPRTQINTALKKNYFQNHNDRYSLTEKGKLFAKNFLLKYQQNNTNIETKSETQNNHEGSKIMNNKKTLNLILYGPPGTGKTYNTIIEAMKIIGSEKINMKDDKGYFKTNYSEDDYKILNEEFGSLKKEGRIEFVTFHQSYSYEEFVEGIKPNLNGNNLSYKLENGIFKRICENSTKKATNNFDEVYEKFINDLSEYNEDNLFLLKTGKGKTFGITVNSNKNLSIYMGEKLTKWGTLTKENLKNISDWKYYATPIYEYLKNNYNLSIQYVENSSKPYILIIDEINRGNISKIFGELITLIEEDKRENLSVTLPYSKETFSVPKNLYIIGTMNTSDRSIASIDIALRRRFKFKEMMPKKELVADFGVGFGDIFEKLNTNIKILLDRDHQIGHSYFIKTKYENADINVLKTIWFSKIIPLLNEYFYLDWEKLKLIIPGFINKSKVPDNFQNECDEFLYEFKTFDEVTDFETALKQEKFEQE